MSGTLSIGELAKETSVKVVTIRYYEQIGLLAAPERTNGNYLRLQPGGTHTGSDLFGDLATWDFPSSRFATCCGCHPSSTIPAPKSA